MIILLKQWLGDCGGGFLIRKFNVEISKTIKSGQRFSRGWRDATGLDWVKV